jgi:hypothetical protein
MENARVINPSDVRMFYFGTKDVLTQSHERECRKQKIQRAVSLPHDEHQKINILIRLPTGETVQTQSDQLGYRDDFVVVKGGHAIPVWAILDVAL